ncbi:hypothetical protein D3C80_1479160 [compost metagenome]
MRVTRVADAGGLQANRTEKAHRHLGPFRTAAVAGQIDQQGLGAGVAQGADAGGQILGHAVDRHDAQAFQAVVVTGRVGGSTEGREGGGAGLGVGIGGHLGDADDADLAAVDLDDPGGKAAFALKRPVARKAGGDRLAVTAVAPEAQHLTGWTRVRTGGGSDDGRGPARRRGRPDEIDVAVTEVLL